MAGGVGKNRLAVMPSARRQEKHTERTAAISDKPGPRRFSRVPTHAVGVAGDRRRAPRASLSLPLRLLRIGGVAESSPVTLVTRDISSSGIYFLAPREIQPGTAVELEVVLVERPLGLGNVQMSTSAHIVRTEETDMPGWRGYGASFDDFSLQRDDGVRELRSKLYTL
jgi:PilZ domain